MAARTYIPELINLLRILCIYIVRYRERIKANAPVGVADKLDTVIAACEALTAVLPVDIPIT